ncbi:unnamed protein product [Periconia digitata]|uniref:Uncharacterized protein n=1 Tax=Periconia digitata TaxID=1303443 RepID=A0A9W4UTZ1_9PLEO|nr:unnamed protein product [Periconia digitata]
MGSTRRYEFGDFCPAIIQTLSKNPFPISQTPLKSGKKSYPAPESNQVIISLLSLFESVSPFLCIAAALPPASQCHRHIDSRPFPRNLLLPQSSP